MHKFNHEIVGYFPFPTSYHHINRATVYYIQRKQWITTKRAVRHRPIEGGVQDNRKDKNKDNRGL